MADKSKTVVKVTETDGWLTHDGVNTWWLHGQIGGYSFQGFFPPEARVPDERGAYMGKRGHFKVTVEFTPEDDE